MAAQKLVIAGDIGGTNSRLQVRCLRALLSPPLAPPSCTWPFMHLALHGLGPSCMFVQLWNLEPETAALLFEKIYASSGHDSMHQLLLTFVEDAGCCTDVTGQLQRHALVTLTRRSPAVVMCAAIGIVGPILDERLM